MDKCANNEENRGLAYNRVVFTVEVPVDLEVSLWQDPNVSRPREHLIVGAVEALREYVLHKQRTDKPYAGVEEDVVEVKDLTLDNGVKVSWEAKSDVGDKSQKNFVLEGINMMIQNTLDDSSRGKVSDGYHTFDELYECRHVLWVKLCELAEAMGANGVKVIRARKHSDGSGYEGWFLLMMVYPDGRQLSFHLPYKYWDKCNFATTLGRAPEFDGHTTADVIERLGEL